MLGINVTLWIAFFLFLSKGVEYDEPLAAKSSLNGNLISAITFLTTFSISTYMGSTLSRFHERFNNCCQTNGNMTLISLLSASQLAGEKPRVATLLRWSNLMFHLYYMLVSGPMDEMKWGILRDRHLVTPAEEEALAPLKKKPSAVYVWINRLIMDLHREGKLSDIHAQRLEACVSGLRGLAAKQIAYQLTPPSFTYFHLMMVMIQIFLGCMSWNSAVRLHDKYLALLNGAEHNFISMSIECIGMLLLIAMLSSVKKIAHWLSNPYGEDATDYDLDFDLRGLWEESVETIKNMRDDKEPDLAARMIAEARRDVDPFLTIKQTFKQVKPTNFVMGFFNHYKKGVVSKGRYGSVPLH